MNIQDLKSNTTWQEASNTINNNNNKISLAIATLENAKLKNKGYFTTLEKLNEAIPNPTIGSKAYVGTSEPYAIYIVENGAWVDSGYTGGDEIVANITTDRIEDGAVTSEKIATSAFDSTLSVSGKIAPANVVGEKLTELDKQINGGSYDDKTKTYTIDDATAGKYIKNTGEVVDGGAFASIIRQPIPKGATKCEAKAVFDYGVHAGLFFYKVDGTFVVVKNESSTHNKVPSVKTNIEIPNDSVEYSVVFNQEAYNYGCYITFYISASTTKGIVEDIADIKKEIEATNNSVTILSNTTTNVIKDVENVKSILAKPQNIVAEDLRLDQNTTFVGSYTNGWSSQNSGVATKEGDCFLVDNTISTYTNNVGIRCEELPDLSSIGDEGYYVSFDVKKYDSNSRVWLFFSSSKYVVFYIDDDSWKTIKFKREKNEELTRIQFSQSGDYKSKFYIKNFSIVSAKKSIEEDIDELKSHILNGKKIAVLGDSISTINGNNTPHWKVLPTDVGRSIESYVTYFDVYAHDTTTLTNKTIGGTLLTASMIGTKQSFVPNASDIGKEIGSADTYYTSDSQKNWAQQLCDLVGCEIVTNASFSGAQMICGQGENENDEPINTKSMALSYAWSDYTIGRFVNNRDDNGNAIVPDIIFIYRGTNDFDHNPKANLQDVDLSGGVPSTDRLEDGTRSYIIAYIKTIQKLREAYPNATIYCCTLNYFFRQTDIGWSRHNGTNTLAEMNDCIRKVANMMGCGLVEFDKDGLTPFSDKIKYYSDGAGTRPTHPNNEGHLIMAKRAMIDVKFVE